MASNTITYFIPNISCNHCVHTVKTELSELNGVQQVDADVTTKEVNVVYDLPATSEKIEALLAEINYPAETKA